MIQSTRSTPRLSPLDGKPILLGFDGADMSSDAGPMPAFDHLLKRLYTVV